jgi:hypothetical protein
MSPSMKRLSAERDRYRAALKRIFEAVTDERNSHPWRCGLVREIADFALQGGTLADEPLPLERARMEG